jgi:replicative DNA helicase
LQAYFFFQHPDADKEIYLELFRTLSETPLDPEVGVGLLKAIKRRRQALELSEASMKYASGYGDLGSVIELSKQLEEEKTDDLDDDIVVVSDDLEFLLNETVSTPGLRWRLNCLNKSLGSLRKGDFGFLFARPETGKTTFLASEVSHMLTQLKDDDGPVVWFNLEEQGNKVMLRVYQAYFGITLQQLLANPKKYKEEFQRQVKGRFKLVDNASLDKKTVEKTLERLKPSLVVQDQTPKIKGFAADREDLRLGAIFLWSRELSKEYCPIIGVIQAGGSAENQKWLTMDHVDNVKTAAQAEADWILGVGKTHADGAEFVRYLNISKNKLAGDATSIPELRHGRFETWLEPEVARYKDVMKFDD